MTLHRPRGAAPSRISAGWAGRVGRGLVGAIALAATTSMLLGCLDESYETPTESVASSVDSVVGGRAAPDDELHGTLALILRRAPGMAFCTGTLITPTTVLTAAHCVVDDDDQVLSPSEIVIGTAERKIRDMGGDQIYEVSEVIPHHRYPDTATLVGDPDGLGSWGDIALLTLPTPVDTLTPTPIVHFDDVAALLQPGADVTIAGYGFDGPAGTLGVLMTAETPYVRRSNSEFIAGGTNNPDTCPGDSGGPVYMRTAGTTVLVGTTSRGMLSSTSPCGDGGVYTLTSAYADWIADNSPDFAPTRLLQANSARSDEAENDAPDDAEAAESETDSAVLEQADEGCSMRSGSKQSKPWAPLMAAVVFGLIASRRRRA